MSYKVFWPAVSIFFCSVHNTVSTTGDVLPNDGIFGFTCYQQKRVVSFIFLWTAKQNFETDSWNNESGTILSGRKREERKFARVVFPLQMADAQERTRARLLADWRKPLFASSGFPCYAVCTFYSQTTQIPFGCVLTCAALQLRATLHQIKAYSHQTRINSFTKWANNLVWIHPQNPFFRFLNKLGDKFSVNSPIGNNAMVQFVPWIRLRCEWAIRKKPFQFHVFQASEKNSAAQGWCRHVREVYEEWTWNSSFSKWIEESNFELEHPLTLFWVSLSINWREALKKRVQDDLFYFPCLGIVFFYRGMHLLFCPLP